MSGACIIAMNWNSKVVKWTFKHGIKITVTYLPNKVLKEDSISLRQISIHVCRQLSGTKEASVCLCYISGITVKSEGLVTPHLNFSRGKLLHCLEVTLWKENLLRTWLEALTERREEVASALLPPGSSGSLKPKLPPLQSSWEWCLELSLSSKWFWFISNSRNTGLVFPRVFLLRLQLETQTQNFSMSTNTGKIGLNQENTENEI